jgi:hypothetical protein
MARARDMCSFQPKNMAHRRGGFPTLSTGPSYGGGQRVPGNLVNTGINEEAVKMLLADPDISRIAGFASSKFSEPS